MVASAEPKVSLGTQQAGGTLQADNQSTAKTLICLPSSLPLSLFKSTSFPVSPGLYTPRGNLLLFSRIPITHELALLSFGHMSSVQMRKTFV